MKNFIAIFIQKSAIIVQFPHGLEQILYKNWIIFFIGVNDRTETQNAQTLLSIQDLIPHYFTRQMRKNMLERV